MVTDFIRQSRNIDYFADVTPRVTLAPCSRASSGWSRGCCRDGWRLAARVAAQGSDGIEQLEPMPDCCDPKLLQGLVRRSPERVSRRLGKGA